MKVWQTTPERPWQEAELKETAHSGAGEPLRVTRTSRHPLLGFGGCFNELGARELFALPKEQQAEVLGNLFSDDGCAFRFCRMPIGASDYAISWYSHHETPGDYEMESFSIARDEEWLLPYIKAAREIRSDLSLFASPWSPPVWLKEPPRYNGSRLRQEPRVYKALAEYFLRFVRAYGEAGIEISQIHVQNEPNSDQKFPSCLWRPEEMRDFIRDYLGPRFEEAGQNCEIWAGTLEKGLLFGWAPQHIPTERYQSWMHTILRDPATRRFVAGAGFQWAGKGALPQTRADWPELPIIQTENECGNGENSWDYAFYVFDLMWHYFRAEASAYVYWNMILPPGGLSTWGWPQNTMITIDGPSREITYNPEFWVMKHLSHFVRPGACPQHLEGSGAAFSLLFENEDGGRVLAFANPVDETLTFNLAIEGLPGALEIPPRSISTLVLDGCAGRGQT